MLITRPHTMRTSWSNTWTQHTASHPNLCYFALRKPPAYSGSAERAFTT